MKDESVHYEAWMFRMPNEYLALLFSLILLLGIGLLLSTFNIYVSIGALIIGLIYIKLQQAQFIGSAIRVYENQYPEIYEIFKDHAKRLGIHRGSLYIMQDPTLNAYTIGVNTCSIILTSSLVEQLTLKELSFVLGHELGHFKAGHTKVSSFVAPLGKGNVFSRLIFGFWQRKAEFTADRCGLMLTKDIDTAIVALIKMSIGAKLFEKLDLKGYIAQIRTADRASVKLSEVLVDHPLVTNRIRNLLLYWKESFKHKHEMS